MNNYIKFVSECFGDFREDDYSQYKSDIKGIIILFDKMKMTLESSAKILNIDRSEVIFRKTLAFFENRNFDVMQTWPKFLGNVQFSPFRMNAVILLKERVKAIGSNTWSSEHEDLRDAFLSALVYEILLDIDAPMDELELLVRNAPERTLMEYVSMKNDDDAMRVIGHVQHTTSKNLEAPDANQELNELFKDYEARIAAKAEEIYQNLDDQITNALKGTRAQGILKQAFTLWESKEKTHRQNFNIGILTFCLIVGFSMATLVYNWENIRILIAEVSINSDQVGTAVATTQMLSRVVLVSLPFGLVLWVLRAVMRWANLNLTLAEDASQRSVLAQTYVNFLAEGKVVEGKDREVMLAALFRPLPGVQEIDAGPTTVMDLVKSQKKK